MRNPAKPVQLTSVDIKTFYLTLLVFWQLKLHNNIYYKYYPNSSHYSSASSTDISGTGEGGGGGGGAGGGCDEVDGGGRYGCDGGGGDKVNGGGGDDGVGD